MFNLIFGQDNILIGVTTITAILMLLEKDLTLSPISNTFKLLALNIFIGVSAYIASSNMYLAIFINFITIFLLSYRLCYNLTNPIYLPFSLQYIFILANPVGNDKLLIRFYSLIFGAICIMLTQIIFNRNKMSSSTYKIFNTICENFIKKLSLLNEQENISTLDKNIDEDISKLKKIIYDKRKNHFYLTNQGRILINLSYLLEKLNLLINKIEFTKDKEEFSNDLKMLILKFQETINNKDKKEFNTFLQPITNKYETVNNCAIVEIINTLTLLNHYLNKLYTLEKSHYNFIEKLQSIPTKFQIITLHKRNLSSNSIKFSYALRMALGISIGGFIMDFFHLSEGRWILLTILSLINPMYEVSKEKTKDRIWATVIGSMITLILFTMLKDPTSINVVLILVGYISSFASKYKYNMICVTISAIGSAALIKNAHLLIINRLLFIILGAIMVTIINKLVLPHNIERVNKDLKVMYKATIKEMLKELYATGKNTQNNHSMKNLFLVTSLIENKFKLNNETLNNQNHTSLVKNYKLLSNNLYELYMWILRNKENKSTINSILEYLKLIIESNYAKANDMMSKLKLDLEYIQDVNNKTVFNLLMNISKNLKTSNIYC